MEITISIADFVMIFVAGLSLGFVMGVVIMSLIKADERVAG